MILYGYFRSSAAYRIRIALNLKGLDYDQVAVNLREGAQSDDGYLGINPQGLVPALDTGEHILEQSIAILEWLEETYPKVSLLPGDSFARARIRSLAQHIACDIHPLNNLRILNYLKSNLDQDEEARNRWYRHWIRKGFSALEQQVGSDPFCVGAQPTMADICLVPQVYNAKRFGVDMQDFPRLEAINTHCLTLQAFKDAMPSNQPDAI
ncbi:maleylacetoacetate isomerase [Spongorhabdus nitratireducens]